MARPDDDHAGLLSLQEVIEALYRGAPRNGDGGRVDALRQLTEALSGGSLARGMKLLGREAEARLGRRVDGRDE
jgi:hypothetical protein